MMFRAPIILLLVTMCITTACHDPGTPAAGTRRTFKMGFANSAPRFDDINLFIQSLDLWTTRADAAIVSNEVPWSELLAGMRPGDYVVDNFKDIVDYYRSKDLTVWVYIDPANGLDRSGDSQELQAAGKSIADADIQRLYVKYVIAMDSVLRPKHLGLALETNLIRASAPKSIYNGIVAAANGAAIALKAAGSDASLSVSIQVEQAWGGINGGGSFQGIQQDLDDFPFLQELGMSSYPYFRYNTPDDIPDDYYSRIASGTGLHVFVSEGGWTSKTLTAGSYQISSSEGEQASYMQRQKDLLSNCAAVAWFQLTFTDIDLTGIPPGTPDIIRYFAFLGLVDTNFRPKPALQEWDKVFALNLAEV